MLAGCNRKQPIQMEKAEKTLCRTEYDYFVQELTQELKSRMQIQNFGWPGAKNLLLQFSSAVVLGCTATLTLE